jgi:hypothetical protein
MAMMIPKNRLSSGNGLSRRPDFEIIARRREECLAYAAYAS